MQQKLATEQMDHTVFFTPFYHFRRESRRASRRSDGFVVHVVDLFVRGSLGAQFDASVGDTALPSKPHAPATKDRNLCLHLKCKCAVSLLKTHL